MPREPLPEDDKGRSYWGRIAPRYDWSMLLLGRPFPRMLALVENELHGDDAVLEIRAGTGLLTAPIARTAQRVMATDDAPAVIERVRGDVPRTGRCSDIGVHLVALVPRRPGILLADRRGPCEEPSGPPSARRRSPA